jgi:hypothetical protein
MKDKVPDMRDNLSRVVDSVFGKTARQAPAPDEAVDVDLPDSGASYQAFARASNEPVYTLHCCLGKDGYRSFQYVHLDSDSTFEQRSGHVITLRFAGTKLVQVTITGRNLERLFFYLHDHRMPWIMLADRDFAEDGEPLITGIAIDEVTMPAAERFG